MGVWVEKKVPGTGSTAIRGERQKFLVDNRPSNSLAGQEKGR